MEAISAMYQYFIPFGENLPNFKPTHGPVSAVPDPVSYVKIPVKFSTRRGLGMWMNRGQATDILRRKKRSRSLFQGRAERKCGIVGKTLHLESESLDLNANSITY